jgi:hypothetical protein
MFIGENLEELFFYDYYIVSYSNQQQFTPHDAVPFQDYRKKLRIKLKTAQTHI